MLHRRPRQLTDWIEVFSIAAFKKCEVKPVSVAHDLSSEIAAAVLARKEDQQKLKELKEVVLRVHVVLQKLTTQCREQNRRQVMPDRNCELII